MCIWNYKITFNWLRKIIPSRWDLKRFTFLQRIQSLDFKVFKILLSLKLSNIILLYMLLQILIIIYLAHNSYTIILCNTLKDIFVKEEKKRGKTWRIFKRILIGAGPPDETWALICKLHPFPLKFHTKFSTQQQKIALVFWLYIRYKNWFKKLKELNNNNYDLG